MHIGRRVGPRQTMAFTALSHSSVLLTHFWSELSSTNGNCALTLGKDGLQDVDWGSRPETCSTTLSGSPQHDPPEIAEGLADSALILIVGLVRLFQNLAHLQ